MLVLKPMLCSCGYPPTKYEFGGYEFGGPRSIHYFCNRPECLKEKQEKALEAKEQAAIERWNLEQSNTVR